MKQVLNNPANPFALLLMALAMALTFLACEEKGKKAEAGGGEAEAELAAVEPKAVEAEIEEASEAPTFKSVKIGEQTWMAENLNVETADSWCYDNDKSNCDKYGRLYTWEAAKKACPSGWHLPSFEEWNNLMDAVGGMLGENDWGVQYGGAGEKLKSKVGWSNNSNGTDNYEFSALPGGYRYPDGKFYRVGQDGRWWSSFEKVHFMSMHSVNFDDEKYGNDNVSSKFDQDKSEGNSVRCVKD